MSQYLFESNKQMESPKFQNQCQTHSLDYIAIDLNPEQETQNRYLCPKCLTTSMKQKTINLVSDVDQHFLNIKKQFKSQKEVQSKQNLEILNELATSINDLKNYYVQSLEAILLTIKKQIAQITDEQEKLEENLMSVNIDSYLEQKNEFAQRESKYLQIQKNIQQQFSKLQNEQPTEKCLNIIKEMNNEIIVLVPEWKKEKKIIKKESTPKLQLVCKQHEKEIILFYLNEKRNKDNRIGCISCITGKMGPFTELLVVQQLWQDYENQKKNILLKQQEFSKTKVEGTQQLLKDLLKQFQEKIIDVANVLTEKQINLEDTHQQVISTMERDWLTFTKEEILDIAETLSNPKYLEILQTESEQEFKKQDNQVNLFIQESLQHLKLAQISCFEKLYQAISSLGQLKISKIVDIDFGFQKKFSYCKVLVLFRECQRQLTVTVIDGQKYKKEKPKLQQKLNILKEERKNNRKFTQKIVLGMECLQKRINYQLLSQFSLTQNEYCYALAFNLTGTVMVAGCNNQIKVFDFQQGQLKQVQLLTDHTAAVVAFSFAKKSEQFFSGSQDTTIRFWINNSKQWCCQQVLTGHTGHIHQLLMNNNEDLLISCSYDQTIKFWTKKNDWQLFQNYQCHTNIVWAISLNEAQNQLVSWGQDNLLVISQLGSENKWAVYQQISVAYGWRLSFVGNNLITVQQQNGNKMEVYELNTQNKQFAKTQEIPVQQNGSCYYYFPQQYLRRKQIILNRNGYNINIMKKYNNEFVLVQQIKMSHQYLFGALTEDGEFLIIWDYTTKQFQVRKQE